ncbi:hypothetical protein Tco_1250256, partial [Tanacetum coccineum]
FIVALRLHTGEEIESLGFARYWDESARQIPNKGDLRDYWIGISPARDFLGTTPSYTSIRDLILRMYHRLIASNIAGRSQAPKKVTVTDLFYLKGMDVGSANILYLFAMYLRLFASGRKSRALISRGQFVARLAEHFGLLTEERLRGLTVLAPALPGPERQPDAAAGAHEAVEDASAVDEDMPQAVPPPHRTQDFSRFATWTVTSLTRMLNRAGVTYTSYSETPREYQRRTRQRTGKANTSTAQQDQQQQTHDP